MHLEELWHDIYWWSVIFTFKWAPLNCGLNLYLCRVLLTTQRAWMEVIWLLHWLHAVPFSSLLLWFDCFVTENIEALENPRYTEHLASERLINSLLSLFLSDQRSADVVAQVSVKTVWCCVRVSASALKHLLFKVHRKSVHVLLLTSSVKNNSAPDSFQRGLVERQILEVLHGLHRTEAHRTESDPSAVPSRAGVGREAGSVCRKVIQAQDVCPICQEELLEKKTACVLLQVCWTGVEVSLRYCFRMVLMF